jgi:VanZ family protein
MNLAGTESVGRRGTRRSLWIAAFLYLVFVVYGSLVPLDYHPYPLPNAWRDFLHTQYLTLGVESRADWVANILLYMPLAYLLCATFAAGARSIAGRIVRVVLIIVFCGAVAVGVEFTQLFFPPRTVSLNDIVAELIGTGLGVACWLIWGRAIDRLWMEMERGGVPAIRAAVVGYVLAYFAFSLFPYDFLVSAREFSEKLAGVGYGFIMAPTTCERLSVCAGKLVAETVAVIPLGVLLGMILGREARYPYLIGALCGLILGAAIEISQFFLASGVSEGISLVTRSLGAALGIALYRHVRLQRLAQLQPYALPALLLGIPVYLVVLAWANNLLRGGWLAQNVARAGLDGLHWLPFYYHYYTTETHALQSLMATFAMYLPVGFAYWVWTMRRVPPGTHGSAMVPAILVVPLAAFMEMAKLFKPERHPDLTDVLIAIFAAAGGYLLARQLHRWAVQGEPVSSSAEVSYDDLEASAQASSLGVGRGLAVLLLLCGIGIAAWKYPLGGVWLSSALAVYGMCLWVRPELSLPAVLALLPWLNFSAWSGWNLVNEFDLAIAVTLVVRLLRPRDDGRGVFMSPGSKWAIGFLSVSFFASAVVGLFPLPKLDQNALSSYYGSFNSLRQLKGYVWALALLPMLIDASREPRRLEERLSAGILVGLCGVITVIVWERAAFAGLLDFAADYRAEGPFPELHTGGGDIHAYLVLALPFVFGWTVLRPTLLRVVGGIALFVLTSYALGVTFARGGYVGYCGALGVLVIATAIYFLRQRAWKLPQLAGAAVALAVAGVAVVIPIVTGSYMESRLAGSRAEAQTRTGHWLRAIEMRDSSALTELVGMGLGSFPRTVLFKDNDSASATFSFEREGSNGFLRLGSGRPLYVSQRVSAVGGEHYALSLDLRSASPNARVDVFLCEKSAQQSFSCTTQTIPVRSPGKGWEHAQATLDAHEIESRPWFRRRPIVLSLENPQHGSIVDVDNVRLLDTTQRDLVANGDFSRDGARWFFSADDHLPWHIFNLWIEILFEQGWIGVVAVALAVVTSLTRLALGSWRGDLFSATVLSALVGFLLVGFTESLFDSPRVATLFFVLLFVGLIRPTGRGRAPAPARPRSDAAA